MITENLLPSNLLRAKITRKSFRPFYASPKDYGPLAKTLIETFRVSIGRKKRDLLQKIKAIEEEEQEEKKEGLPPAADYKLIRGFSALLERRCLFEARSTIDPRKARRTVFALASKTGATSLEQVQKVLADASSLLGTSQSGLETSLWADLDEELILEDFLPPSSSESLIKSYNLSLAQTALFKCARMEFTASGNWKNIFRRIKWLGLMYAIEQVDRRDAVAEDTGHRVATAQDYYYIVSIDGPLSLFKMTDRYGMSLAKLLSEIVKSDSWSIRADLVERRKNRILAFEESSENLRGMIAPPDNAAGGEEEHPTKQNILSPQQDHDMRPQQQRKEEATFDSSVEEKFARKFVALGTGWLLKREPEPLIVVEQGGKQSVIIPDFSFEKPQVAMKENKVYLEIVGFWTQEYMERKLAKLTSLFSKNDHHILVAVDDTLSCSRKLQLARPSNVITYKNGNVPLEPIVKYLKSLEEKASKEEVAKLLEKRIELSGDVVAIEDLANAHNVLLESARNALSSMDFPGYVKVGDYYLRNFKVDEARAKIEEQLINNATNDRSLAAEVSLLDAVELIESLGLRTNPHQLLDSLGFDVVWDGLDYAKSKVVRKTSGRNQPFQN